MAADDYVLQQVSFNTDGTVQIAYSEAHDQGDHVAIIKVLVFEAGLLPDDVRDLQEHLCDMINLAVEKLRNPPLTRPSGLLGRS